MLDRQGVGGVALSADGTRVLVSRAGTWTVADAAAGAPPAVKLRLDQVGAQVEPRQEWREMFENAWRLQRDLFVNANFGRGSDAAVGGPARAWWTDPGWVRFTPALTPTTCCYAGSRGSVHLPRTRISTRDSVARLNQSFSKSMIPWRCRLTTRRVTSGLP